jgi:hypothetical protein
MGQVSALCIQPSVVQVQIQKNSPALRIVQAEIVRRVAVHTQCQVGPELRQTFIDMGMR